MASLFADDAIYDVRLERAFAEGKDISVLPPIEEAIAMRDPAVSVGGTAIAALIRSACENWITVHHGHEPIIDVLSPVEAKAVWPMFDYIDDGRNALKGYGHYHERYRKEFQNWRITHVVLTRLRSDGVHPWAVKSFAQS